MDLLRRLSVACFGLALAFGPTGCIGGLGGTGGDDRGDDDGGGGSGDDGPGGGGSNVGGGPQATIDCTHKGGGTDYAVGPGQAYERLGDVPFEKLNGGDTVRVFWKEGGYREKIMLGGAGNDEQPIRICGVPGPDGQLPLIDGAGATSRAEDQYPFEGHQLRGVIVVGHRHDAPYEETPGPFVIEGLEVTGGMPENAFTDVYGSEQYYSESAAGIFVQRATGVTIRGCEIYGSANGLFIGTTGDIEATRDVLIEGNYVHDNGRLGSDRQHNSYNEAIDVVYQFNHFGAPVLQDDGYGGNNIKERSAGLIVRYNWIEDGAHLLDIVDAQEAKDVTVPLTEFHDSWVYGNLLYRNLPEGASMIHYGGDSGELADYRKGTLFSFNNTFVVDNTAQGDYEARTLYELSTNEEALWSRNDVFFTFVVPSPVRPVVLMGDRDGYASGIADLSHDWVGPGITPWKNAPDWSTDFVGDVKGFQALGAGASPGFADMNTFRPSGSSMLKGAGVSIEADVPETLRVAFQYEDFATGRARGDEEPPTQGAFAD